MNKPSPLFANFPVEIIEWRDSNFSEDPDFPMENLPRHRTVGFLISETEDALIFVLTVGGFKDNWNAEIGRLIQRSDIISRRRIVEGYLN